MQGEITINGELTEGGDRQDIGVDNLDHLFVQLSINEDGDAPTWHCPGCGEESSDDDPEDGACDGSGKYADCPSHELDEEGDCESCDGSGEIEIHEWEPLPLSWVNSASIHARPDRDEIQVTISVGDPRGALVMSVERLDGQLYLRVPHAGMTSPHVAMEEKHPGWIKLGH